MYLELDFLALLRGNPDIGELSASGLQIDLQVDEHGQSDRDFFARTEPVKEEPGVGHPDSKDSDNVLDADDLNFNLGRQGRNVILCCGRHHGGVAGSQIGSNRTPARPGSIQGR